MGHDEPEQLEERTGLPREGVIMETVGVPDLRGLQADRVMARALLTSYSDRSGNLLSVSQCAGNQIAG